MDTYTILKSSPQIKGTFFGEAANRGNVYSQNMSYPVFNITSALDPLRLS